MDRDELLLKAILDRPDGDVLNIVQAAAELPGDMYDRLSKAYHEIAGNDADPNTMIKLRDDRPHSRACGFKNHAHGPDCSNNCPTCHGK